MRQDNPTQWVRSGPWPLVITSLALMVGTVGYWYWAATEVEKEGRYTAIPPKLAALERTPKKQTVNDDLRSIEKALAQQKWEDAVRLAMEKPEGVRRNALLAKARFNLWRQRGEKAQADGQLIEAAQCYGTAITFYEDEALQARLTHLDALIQQEIQQKQQVQDLTAYAQKCEQQGAWAEALQAYQKLLPMATDPAAVKQKIQAAQQSQALQQRLNEMYQQAEQLEKTAQWEAALKIYRQLLPIFNHPATIEQKMSFCQKQQQIAENTQQRLQRLRSELTQMAQQKRWASILRVLKSSPMAELTDFTHQAQTAIKKEMAFVPQGPFIMGDNRYPEETPRREETTEAYYIDRYEVTNRDYHRFVEATHSQYPPHWKGNIYSAQQADHPVVGISALEAQAYAQWVGKQLPTEMQWEKAARGTDGRLYPWGNEFAPGYCNTFEAQYKGTTPVGSFAKGISPYECHDMAGNALEWTCDSFAPYPGGSAPRYPHPDLWVTRGSSWYYHGNAARCSNRFPQAKETRLLSLGFRCVLDAAGVE